MLSTLTVTHLFARFSDSPSYHAIYELLRWRELLVNMQESREARVTGLQMTVHFEKRVRVHFFSFVCHRVPNLADDERAEVEDAKRPARYALGKCLSLRLPSAR